MFWEGYWSSHFWNLDQENMLAAPCDLSSLSSGSRISARLCGATVLGGSVRPNSCQLQKALPVALIWWLNTCFLFVSFVCVYVWVCVCSFNEGGGNTHKICDLKTWLVCESIRFYQTFLHQSNTNTNSVSNSWPVHAPRYFLPVIYLFLS